MVNRIGSYTKPALNYRQIAVIHAMASGFTYEEIAAAMGISIEDLYGVLNECRCFFRADSNERVIVEAIKARVVWLGLC